MRQYESNALKMVEKHCDICGDDVIVHAMFKVCPICKTVFPQDKPKD